MCRCVEAARCDERTQDDEGRPTGRDPHFRMSVMKTLGIQNLLRGKGSQSHSERHHQAIGPMFRLNMFNQGFSHPMFKVWVGT